QVRPLCRIGIDVGGTFTDFVLANGATGQLTRHKEPSVPSDPSLSVERGLMPLIEKAGVRPEDVGVIMHGTTLLVNAIIQRRGAKVGLVVSKGHRGILESGRGRLASTYDLRARKEEPLVPRNLILETSARIAAAGAVLARATMAEMDGIAGTGGREGIEADTVLLVRSDVHADLENEVVAYLSERLPEVPVIGSADLGPERRELEGSNVAVIN